MTEFGMPWPGAEAGRIAESLGVPAFCTGEFVDHDAYVTVAEMAAATDRALIGPAIAYGFARTPFAHAAAVRRLWKQAPGRVFAGLGSGAYAINRDWCGVEADRPVERMTELVGAVRAWLHAENGQTVRYDGEFYHVRAKVQAPVLGKIDAPILLAGFNKRMAAAAGRVADGVIGHGLFTADWWTEVVRPAVERGAGESERDARPSEHGWLLCAINDDDPERAVTDIRRMIAFYLTVRTYDPYVRFHGWTKQVELIREAFAEKRIDDMTRAVTDDMVDAIGICGSTADAASALRRREGTIARDIAFLAPPSFLVSERRKQAYSQASLALLEPGANQDLGN
ncbi:N5,N10-methylene tetrahydromethanopterin reductase [Amycolatopsis sp. NBRC 101858]|uniref:LLM class flavin-dependent oxidoreductase n=1 Tax=Amycolatopsis sp. NBRC 101858 TaxID=3032200 RepID=UPI0024A54E15|nr:LLM class flavin-dependent oxidoreductase [Amycolatopsis sp. NBRC 101858]GLY38890.1 N5,N10-methylene tetrahydromethanopterin reductase [Amycolatopsis sp. NBRC 101858]